MAREYTPEELGIVYPTDKEYTPAELGLKPTKQKEYTPAELGLGGPQRKPEDVGFLESIPAAAKRGIESLSEMTSGLGLAKTALTGTEAETKAKMEAIKAEQAKPEEKPAMTVADFERIYKEKGFLEAAKEAPKYIVEQFLQSAPQMAGPLAVGSAVGALSGPAGVITGPLAGMGTYAVQQFGNFLVRQAQEKDDPKQLELAKAAITAAGTAPIGYFADRFTVGLGSIEKNAGKEIIAELAKRRAAGEVGAGAVAKTVGKRAAVGATEGIIAEAPTEVLEQAAERYQAGLSLTDDKAMQEYKEAFFGAAAAGGGIGGVSSGVGAYGGYRRDLREERATEAPAARNAFTEATNYENTGNVTGTGEPSVSVPGEQGRTERGIEEPAAGGVGGAELPASRAAVREEALDNQLIELRNEKAKIEAFDPNDPRIGDIEETIKELQIERSQLQTEEPSIKVVGAKKPEQLGLDFEAAAQPEEEMIVPAKEQGLTLEKGEKLPEMAAPEPIEEPETARMGLVGDESAPMAPITSFFNSIKFASANPAQAVQYRNKVKNLLNDIAEFIGGKSTEEVSRYKEEGAPEPIPATGPDVSVPLEPGPELQKRMAVLNNFFDGLSLAPKEREAATTNLVKQLPGMDVNAQTQAFQSLLRIPDINTIRGIDKLRAKFDEAMARYDRRRAGLDEAALPYSSRDTIRSTDPFIERRINEVLKTLEATAKDERTPEEKAAITYFNAWSYITAMRSAAFDLAVPFQDRSNGAAYKGQNTDTAKLFQKWVEENLPKQELARFNATVNEYKKDIIRADQAIENMKKRKEAGNVGPLYEKMLGRAPSGKVPGIFDSGLDKRPGDVTKLDPKDFYPMHPGVVEKIQQGDLKGALTLLAKDPGKHASNKVKFEAKLAQRLLDLNLKTEILVDKQEELANRLIKQTAAQRRMLLQQIQSFDGGIELLTQLGLDKAPTNEATIRGQFQALQLLNRHLTREQIEPVIGQYKTVLDSFKNAVLTLDSAGVYIDAWNTISLNSKANGFSNGVFLHELAHAATYYSLAEENYDSLDTAQKKAVDELKALYAHAVEKFDKHKVDGLDEGKYVTVNGQKFLYDEISYGFTDIQEFVAEAYSNWVFQDYLKTMKYRGTDTGMWSKFVQGVIRLFKLDNVLGYTLANADALMRPTPLFQGQSAYAAVAPSGIRKMLNSVNPASSSFMSGLGQQLKGKPEWNMAKGAVAEFLENVKDTTRKYYLGAFTLRQLDDMVGHRIPQIGKMIKGVEKMLDFRNQKLEKIRTTIEPWMELQSKDPKQADKMHDVMIMATLAEQDPDLGPTKDKELNQKWAALSEQAKKVYREVRQYYKDEYDSYVQIVLDNKKAALLGNNYSQKDIDTAENIKLSGIEQARKNYESKKAADGSKLYSDTEVREMLANDVKAALRAKGYSDDIIDIYNDLYAIRSAFEKNKLEPYFPIRRFGSYSVQFYTGKKKEFYLFESAWARRKFVKEYAEKNKIPADEIFMGNVVKNKVQSTDLEGFQFLKELKDIVHGTKGTTSSELRENIDDAIEQLYYLSLPDKSARKMFIHRTGVPGMSKDMLRGFASSAFHMAYQHSRFKFARELTGYLDAAREFSKKPGDEGKVDKDYVAELENRFQLIMNPPDTGGITGFLSGASFIWYMTSPASAITNMLGIPAVALPVLGAKYGNANAAKTLGEYGNRFFRSGLRNAEGERTFFSLDNKEGGLSKLEKEAFDKFVVDGLLDVTLPHDIAGLAEGTATVYKSAGQKLMNILSTPFHVTERANREIVAMASYKMAFDKYRKTFPEAVAQEKAIEEAKDMTYKSMFDYSTLNKPRYFQHPALKVILQFKQFSQQMTYLLARSAYDAIGTPYTPEELHEIRLEIKKDQPNLTDAELEAALNKYVKDFKKEAKDRLLGTLGMTAVFAGATGMPMWWAVSSIAELLHAAFGDDDEDEYWDFTNWFKNWCNETFGGFVGDSISRGVVSQVLGSGVADRLSLNDLWFRDARKSPDEVTQLQNWAFNLLGPTAGLATNMVTAYGQFKDGYIERSIETASPAFLKNFLKGARFWEEGRATTLRGNELLGDVSKTEAIGQAIGFTPERLAQRQKANIETKTAEQDIVNRKQALRDAFFMSVDTQDDAMFDRVLEKIEKFNQTYPEFGLYPEDLTKSIKTRYEQRALAEMTGGMPISKKLIPRLSPMMGYGNTE